MTVKQGPASKGQAFISSSYPSEEGLVLGTSKIAGRVPYLKPKGVKSTKSLLRSRFQKGL